MSQSGQGEEPLARTAREGIVLPSDGGAPLMPGDLPPAPVQQTGRWWGADQGAAATGHAQQPADPYAQQPADPYAQPWAAPYPQPSADFHGQPSAVPQAQPSADAWNAGPMPEWGGQEAASPGAGAPLPPEGAQGGSYGGETYGGAGFGMPLPPVAGEASAVEGGASAPAASSAGVPLPPVAPMDEAATQYLPPVAAQAPGAEAATQYLPPVGPGALPPEAPSDATTFLGRVPNGGAGPLPPTAHTGQPPHGAPPAHPDAQATQYIPPVAIQPQPQTQPRSRPQPYGAPEPQGQQGQQGDVFDSLFRSEPGGEGATQQLPRVEHEQPYAAGPPPQGPGHGGHGHRGRGSARRDGGGGGGRTRSRVPLIAGVGIGIAVLGIGAGALMSIAGSESDPRSDNKPVSATDAGPEESASPSADPAKEQAVALDQLLADSGNSRNSVVKAVSNIRSCQNLGQAATDLRNAAKQRTDLVTKLGGLSVDELPNHAALTTALTNAWKASASADDHYAAWADQVAGKKGCKKGQARNTGQTQAGNKASATASAEKTKAAEVWNAIATTYGLTERQAGQL